MWGTASPEEPDVHLPGVIHRLGEGRCLHFELFAGKTALAWVRSQCFVRNPSHPILSSEKFSGASLSHLRQQELRRQHKAVNDHLSL
jgi:hypothetical protein